MSQREPVPDQSALVRRRMTVLKETHRALDTVRMYLDSIDRELAKDGGDEIRVLFEIGQVGEYVNAADRRLAVWHALGELASLSSDESSASNG